MNKTIQLYNQDSHMNKFQATVLSCTNEVTKDNNSHYIVILDATAFFPEGGGQSSDIGTLGGVLVVDVQEKEDIIYHTLTAPLQVGDTVTGEINWEKRFDNMQHHTGEHIVSGIVHQYFGYDNVGFHLGSDVVTIDFNGSLTDEDIRMVETKANQAVFSNLPIDVKFPSSEALTKLDYRSKIELTENVRIVTIPNIDICACCAPHVSFTGEIGLIKIVSWQKYKGGVRLSMLCGNRALADYNKKEVNVTEISALLSAKPYEVSEAVKHLKDEALSLKGQISNLNNQLLKFKAASIPEGTKSIYIFEKDIEPGSLRTYANMILERCENLCAVFAGSDDTGYKYILASSHIDVREIGKQLNEHFSGKGGGSKEMIQGSIVGSKEMIQGLLNKLETELAN